jgi:hypothetical protein
MNDKTIQWVIWGTVILIAFYFIYSPLASFTNGLTTSQSLQSKIQTDADYVETFKQIKQVQSNYANIISEVSRKYYTEPKLFSLWKHASSKLPGSISFTINPKYTVNNSITYFNGTVIFTLDPLTSIKEVEAVKPSLHIVGIAYNGGKTTINFQAPILTQNKQFIITPQLYQEASYVVVRLVMYSPDRDLIPGGLFVSKENGIYYAGNIIESGLDIISAQDLAYKYSQQGIITFIAKQNVQSNQGNGGA